MDAGSPLLDIGDLTRLEVTADILTEDAVLIAPGQEVEVHGAAIGREPIKGRVKRVDPQGITKVSSLGVEQQRVPVIVSLDAGELSEMEKRKRTLGLEFRVRVRIYTAQDEKAVIVPRQALIRREDGKWALFALQNGRAVLTTVKVGLTNDRQAQVLDGIKTDDLVVVAPPKDLVDGQKIAATQ